MRNESYTYPEVIYKRQFSYMKNKHQKIFNMLDMHYFCYYKVQLKGRLQDQTFI